MAVLAGFTRGVGPVVANGTPLAGLRLGAAANITTGAASATVTLPADSNGNPYSIVLLTQVGGAAWWNFNTAGDAAVKAAANTFAINSSYTQAIVVPPGATNISAIQDSAGGTLNIVGLY